jgi:2-hydroxychromene-2-carboxylate isomerase
MSENPYYAPAPMDRSGILAGSNSGFSNAGIGQMFSELGNLQNFGAQNQQRQASADYNQARTMAARDQAMALRENPQALAALFLSGGQTSTPTLRTDYATDKPFDYSLNAPPQDNRISSIFTNNQVSPNEQIARGMQEHLMRGGKIEDFARVLAQGGYLNKVNAGDADAGMGFLPFMGLLPSKNTALSTARQDVFEKNELNKATAVQGLANSGAMQRQELAGTQALALSDRNSANMTKQQIAVEDAKAVNREALAELNFEIRSDGSVVSNRTPANVPSVTASTMKMLGEQTDSIAKNLSIKLDPTARLSIITEAARRTQDVNLIDAGYKNPSLALESVVKDLQDGLLMGLQQTPNTGISSIFGADNKVTRVPDANNPNAFTPVAPKFKVDPRAIQNARKAIADGAPREAVIKRLQDNGIDTRGL